MSRFENKKLLIFAAAVFLAAAIGAVYWVRTLQVAHGSFEEYYRFRGCAQLLEKTDTYGICKTSAGSTIKIVLFEGKWYLDGDLPGQW